MPMKADSAEALRALRLATAPDRMVFIGVDLGQRGSHTAIVILERFEEWQTNYVDILRGEGVSKS